MDHAAGGSSRDVRAACAAFGRSNEHVRRSKDPRRAYVPSVEHFVDRHGATLARLPIATARTWCECAVAQALAGDLDVRAFCVLELNHNDVVEQQMQQQVVADRTMQRVPSRRFLQKRNERVGEVAHDAVRRRHAVTGRSWRSFAVPESEDVGVIGVCSAAHKESLASEIDAVSD